jgi:hypothetical protein
MASARLFSNIRYSNVSLASLFVLFTVIKGPDTTHTHHAYHIQHVTPPCTIQVLLHLPLGVNPLSLYGSIYLGLPLSVWQYLSRPFTFTSSSNSYYMAKETYYMAKETYYMAKETYYMAKEPYLHLLQ